MTNHVVRLYALAATLLVFFVAWGAIAARPWKAAAAAPAAGDPRVAALKTRELQLKRDALAVQRVVNHRWAVYRVKLGQRTKQIATAKHAARVAAAQAPAVRVVTLPPVTVTRTS